MWDKCYFANQKAVNALLFVQVLTFAFPFLFLLFSSVHFPFCGLLEALTACNVFHMFTTSNNHQESPTSSTDIEKTKETKTEAESCERIGTVKLEVS